jgi:hypothetical protein
VPPDPGGGSTPQPTTVTTAPTCTTVVQGDTCD